MRIPDESAKPRARVATRGVTQRRPPATHIVELGKRGRTLEGIPDQLNRDGIATRTAGRGSYNTTVRRILKTCNEILPRFGAATCPIKAFELTHWRGGRYRVVSPRISGTADLESHFFQNQVGFRKLEIRASECGKSIGSVGARGDVFGKVDERNRHVASCRSNGH